MPAVDIPDVGTVEFPDSMSEDDIKSTIKRKFYIEPALKQGFKLSNDAINQVYRIITNPAAAEASSMARHETLAKAQQQTQLEGKSPSQILAEQKIKGATAAGQDLASGESLVGISPEDIPSGADTTAPAITIPLSAAAKTAASAAQFATSGKGILQLAATATPMAPVMYAKWAYDMLKGGVESVKDAGEAVANLIKGHINRQMQRQQGEPVTPVDQQEVQRLADDAVNTAVSIIGGGTAAAGAVHPLIRRTAEVAPLTADALQKETAQAGKGPDALHEKAGTVLPSLRAQPEQGVQQVPVTPSVEETGARSAQAGEQKSQAVADYERYQQIRQEMKGKTPEEMAELGKEMIDIQKRHRGYPPLPPEYLRPAVQIDETGPPTAGELGDSHADIIAKTGKDPESIPHEDPRRGFIDVNNPNKLIDRKTAETRSGLKGTAEAGGLDSQDLPGGERSSEIKESGIRAKVIGVGPVETFGGHSVTVAIDRTDMRGVSESDIRNSLPENLRSEIKEVERFRGSVVPSEKGPALGPAKTRITFKTKEAAQQAYDYFKGKEATPQSAGESEVETKPAVEPAAKGIAASVRNKWTTATESPLGSEAGFINIDPLKEFVEKVTPYAKSAFEFIRDLGKEQLRAGTMDDYRKSVLNWSAKLQRSFGEASSAQREIQSKVPDPIRREGITNWIQADGDRTVLQQRLAATKDPKLAKGYQAALDLTPEEIAVANDVRNAYNTLGQRGLSYDVLKNFKDNYVTQIWNLRKGLSMAGARTLQDKFRFSKASTFDTFFDGEQAGYTPKTKDISKLLPTYLHEMNAVIAARQLVQDLSKGVASDGRPLVVPRGVGIPVDNASGSATLIVPKAVKGDTGDYKVLPNQPALNDWRWASKDQAGNPIFLKSDLALHPEAYDRLKNVLGRSAIREWYSTKTSLAAQIPKLLVHGLDIANSETKRTMLGLLAPFHQVQEGTHGIGHRVNPTFNIPKVDLVNDPVQMDAARHGLMLMPDRASANQFMEGFRVSGLVSKIPGLGTLADQYSNYLFHQYIPGLKFKTYQAILERNMAVYANDLASGAIKEADVKHLSAEQTNAAYGHLNYTDLARNPTIQHIMQLGLLAPDFFEARARFTGQSIKGATGAKVGREQVIALTTLAVAQAATAYTAAQLTGGQWDKKHPFEFHVGTRRYTLRSVPEDISSLLNNARTFIYSRISPIIGKGALQYASGVDWRGQKVSAGQTTKELLEQPIPISIRGFLGLGRQSLSGWEQLASAVGLRISRYSPANDVFQMAQDWMKSNPDPKVQKRLQVQQASTFPVSDYASLRNALHDNNMSAARDAYRELLKTKSADQVYRAMSHPHPFTGAAASDKAFVKSLDESQLKIYKQAVAEQRNTLKKFQSMRSTFNENQ